MASVVGDPEVAGCAEERPQSRAAEVQFLTRSEGCPVEDGPVGGLASNLHPGSVAVRDDPEVDEGLMV